jgi:hypothetical protein
MRLQPDASVVGHLSATATGLVTQRHNTVPMNECRVQATRPGVSTPLNTSLATSSRCALQCRVYLPRGHPSGLGGSL